MTHPLRPNVCILLCNNEGQLFLGERAGHSEHWQFPQGGIDDGEAPEESAIRELEEEIGVSPDQVRVVKRLRATHEYDWDEVRRYGEKYYRGQSQVFLLIEFLGEDSDINLQTAHPEFMRWKWCSSPEVRTIAAPIRLTSYLMPLREFEDYLLLLETGFVS